MTSSLVLGGAGFIGSHLAEALVREGHRVRVFDRPHVDRLPLFARGFEVFTGDFLNPQALAPALEGAEVVFHLVSTTLPKNSNDNPAYDVESNVLGTLRLLELCRSSGVRKLVYVSSGGTVYGPPRSVPVREDHPTEPICSYGVHKLMVEKHLHLEHHLHGLDYCVLRPPNLYGPRQRLDTAQGAVAVFLDRALRGEPIEIWGDGSVVRDYVYVADAVDALLKAARLRSPSAGEPRVFNLSSGRGTSLKELVAAIEALLGHPVRVNYSAARALDVPVNVLDASAAARHLGWRASTPLAEGLRRTYEWLRASPS
ncbi:MAG TPA: NAD-dependent epimerase/dehydratase family protein [Burkholderiales bacterium]|nr:NAD-dependent epimerase/dehydratase family protein [Burkholderiales bacterium]